MATTTKQYTVKKGDDQDYPYEILDPGGDVYDACVDLDEAFADCKGKNRQLKVNELREALTERIDELEDDDHQSTIDALTAALNLLKRI